MSITTGKPLLDVLSGTKTEKPPFWFMRQAGRYLPEYRALRQEKGGFLEMAFDPQAACEITMQPIRRFEMDGAIIFSDILVIPMALGQYLEFVQGEGPKLDPINTADDVAKLGYSGFSKLEPVYEALGNVKTTLGNEGFKQTTLIGFCGAPWTVATYMIEGGSSKDFMKTKLFAYQNPEAFDNLIALLVESSAAYLINQINAGAEVVKIFDSWAGSVDQQSFYKWCVEPIRRIVDIVHGEYPHVPIIGFPRGAGYNYLEYVQDSGVTAVALDQFVPTQWAARAIQPNMPVQGNLDPAILRAGGDVLIRASEEIMSDLQEKPYIFNLGHGINKDTPVENVELLVKILKG